MIYMGKRGKLPGRFGFILFTMMSIPFMKVNRAEAEMMITTVCKLQYN